MDYRQALRDSWNHRREGLSRRTSGDGGGPRSPFATARDEAPKPQAPRHLRRKLYDRFLSDIETRGSDGLFEPREVRAHVRRLLAETLSPEEEAGLSPRERVLLEDEVISEIRGLGPLDRLFSDPTVSDILVNGPGEVWIDRFGRLERTDVRFDDDAHLLRLLRRLVSAQGRHLDEASPTVDARLPDGSRLHALIPPLSPHTVVSVRRMRPAPFTLGELAVYGTLSPAMGDFLAAAVESRLNILISGGTGSGKTALLNVLSTFIPPGERVVTIEETAELRLDHPHVVSLEARLPNIEGRGEVSLRTLVKNTLRMRPDRIIVGEVRGAEVFDMLQAMNTGHEGSLTTVHANHPEDALRRLEHLVLMGGFELPSRAIRELLGSAFDIIVQTTRFLDGARRVTSIREVAFENERLLTRELFRFDPEGGRESGRGRHAATGVRPYFEARLARTGLAADTIFAPADVPGEAAGETLEDG
jgi:pilus assembly protein CpaF